MPGTPEQSGVYSKRERGQRVENRLESVLRDFLTTHTVLPASREERERVRNSQWCSEHLPEKSDWYRFIEKVRLVQSAESIILWDILQGERTQRFLQSEECRAIPRITPNVRDEIVAPDESPVLSRTTLVLEDFDLADQLQEDLLAELLTVKERLQRIMKESIFLKEAFGGIGEYVNKKNRIFLRLASALHTGEDVSTIVSETAKKERNWAVLFGIEQESLNFFKNEFLLFKGGCPSLGEAREFLCGRYGAGIDNAELNISPRRKEAFFSAFWSTKVIPMWRVVRVSQEKQERRTDHPLGYALLAEVRREVDARMGAIEADTGAPLSAIEKQRRRKGLILQLCGDASYIGDILCLSSREQRIVPTLMKRLLRENEKK